MGEKDFMVGTVGIPQVGQVSTKPRYLVVLNPGPVTKSKPFTHFIALDKPTFEESFISVKGFYSNLSEDEIVGQFAVLVANTPKDQIQELLLPNHRVHCIRNLIFNANKTSTLPNK